MKVKDAMTPNITSVSPKTSLTEASKAMRDLNVGALPVVAGHELAGIITDRDITVRAGAQHWDYDKKTVADAMTTSVTSCRDTDDLGKAVRQMEAAQIRRLPVKNKAGELVGLLSLGDIALRADHELSGEALEAISRHGQMATAG
jgi:CBS domain-containing protein